MPGSSAGSAAAGARRMLGAGLVLAALAPGVAGCGSPGGQSAANPLAGASAKHIVTRAIADLGKAKSVRVQGVIWNSGKRMRLDLRMAREKGCTGRLSLAGEGSIRLVMIGKTLWFKPDKKFLRRVTGGNSAAMALMSGKYLKTTHLSKFTSIVRLCQPATIAKFFKGAPKDLVKRPATTISGQPAVKVTGSDGAAAYVSEMSTPEFLKITASHHHRRGYLTFSGYGARVPLHRPPAGQTLDGKQLGF